MRLGDCITTVRGVSYKPADLHQQLDKDSVVLLRANNIADETINHDEVQYVDLGKVRDQQYLRKGDILVCASSGSKKLVGKAALIRDDLREVFGAFCLVVRPSDSVEPSYLGHYFQSRQYRDAIEEACTGSNINNLKPAHFNELDVAVPSMPEQMVAAARMDSVRYRIDECLDLSNKFDELVKSRFVEMFGSPTEQHGGWSFDRIDAFCDVVTGNTPSRKKPEYYGDGIEWIKTDNITEAAYLTEASERLSAEGEKVGRVASAGSVLMACIAGSVKSIGKVAIADRPVAFNQQINALIPHEGAIETEYLLWTLRLSKNYLCSDINMQLKGILNKSNLSKKVFSVPPLALQQEFAAFVQQVDKLKFS